jgi:hypothetical protein
LTGYLGGDESIPEKDEIVVSTNTMSYDEFLSSWMYSWMIITFHMGGWTQVLSRYYHATGENSYFEFYDRLENYLQSSNNFLGSQYSDTWKTLNNYLNGSNEFDGKGFNLIWKANSLFHNRRNQVFEEIESLFEPHDELMQLQRCFMTDSWLRYPFKAKFSKDYWGIINDDRKEGEVEYEFNSVSDWETDQEYKDKLYFLRRQGFGKTVIRKRDEAK